MGRNNQNSAKNQGSNKSKFAFSLIIIFDLLFISAVFVSMIVDFSRGEDEEVAMWTPIVLPFALLLIGLFSGGYALIGAFKSKRNIITDRVRVEDREQKNNKKYKKVKKFVSTSFDDFYPFPRKFKINADPEVEDKYHVRLNYQNIIERLTRKMYILFVSIALSSIIFASFVYLTSIHEVITPQNRVMSQFTTVLKNIQDLENTTADQQLSVLYKDTLGFRDSVSFMSDKERSQLFHQIKEKTVEYEDKLISSISSQFFSVYYGRYIAVRVAVLLVMLSFLSFQIKLYFKFRLDRNDYIRKEEALSVYFYFIDMTQKWKKFENKVPDFPLNQLFEHPKNKNSKNQSLDVSSSILEMVNNITQLVSSQSEVMQELLKKNQNSNKKNAKV